jgi:serine/threonine protein phosphatase PrpC
LSFYAVYDGHGGIDCADFVSKHLHHNLAYHNEFSNTAGGVPNDVFKRALVESFMLTNKQWFDRVDRCSLSHASGSTAVVAAIQDRTVFIAWAGDSSALLFLKNGVWLDFVVPHKPSIEVCFYANEF